MSVHCNECGVRLPSSFAENDKPCPFCEERRRNQQTTQELLKRIADHLEAQTAFMKQILMHLSEKAERGG